MAEHKFGDRWGKVRANIFFPEWASNLVRNRAMNLGAQLGLMSITKLSLVIGGLAKWAPIIALNFCCLGTIFYNP